MLERLPTKLEGVVLLGPAVHGDERDKVAPTLAEVGETLPF